MKLMLITTLLINIITTEKKAKCIIKYYSYCTKYIYIIITLFIIYYINMYLSV